MEEIRRARQSRDPICSVISTVTVKRARMKANLLRIAAAAPSTSLRSILHKYKYLLSLAHNDRIDHPYLPHDRIKMLYENDDVKPIERVLPEVAVNLAPIYCWKGSLDQGFEECVELAPKSFVGGLKKSKGCQEIFRGRERAIGRVWSIMVRRKRCHG